MYDPIISWGFVGDKAVKEGNNVQLHPFQDTKHKENQELLMSIMNGMTEMAADKHKIKENNTEDDRRLDTPGRYFKIDNEPPEIINQKAINAF